MISAEKLKKYFLNIYSLIIITVAVRIIWINLPPGIFHGWNEVYYYFRAEHIINGGSYLNGLFDNPPLFTYALALLFKIFGANLIVGRLFIVFLSTSTTLLVYLIMVDAIEYEKRWDAAYFFSLFPLTIIFGKIIQIDFLLILFLLLATYYLLKNNFYLTGIFWGLALFSKFPALVFVFPLMYYFIIKKYNLSKLLIVIILAVAVNVPWYIYVLLTKPDFLFYSLHQGGRWIIPTVYDFIQNGLLFRLAMALLMISILIFFILYLKIYKPKNFMERFFALYTFFFLLFATAFPIHIYYLLPSIAPLSILLASKHKLLKISFVLGICGVLIVSTQPVWDINYESIGRDILSININSNTTILSTTPPQLEFQIHRKVILLNIHNVEEIVNNSILVITKYDYHISSNKDIMHLIKLKYIIYVKRSQYTIYITPDLS